MFKKRLTAVLSALCMTWICLPMGQTIQMTQDSVAITASASGFSPPDKLNRENLNLTWTFDEPTGVLTISGTGEMLNRPWFNQSALVRSVVIGEGVTSIGECAFYAFSNLESVVIPDTVTSIGDHAFDACLHLKKIHLPDRLTSIGEDAFSGCIRLTEVKIPYGVTSIGAGAFSYCEKLASVSIPETVTSIGGYCFENTPWLETKRTENPLVIINDILIDADNTSGDVVIPDGVREIAPQAYSGWLHEKSITSLTIPGSVKHIGDYAFSDSRTLSRVEMAEGIESIESHAFCSCEALKDIQIPESVVHFGESAFDSTPWLTEKLKENPLVIVNHCLLKANKCTGEVVIPDGVTTIENSAFNFANEMTSVVLPKSVTEIGDDAFTGCSKLVQINLPEGLTSIGSRSFSGCSGLTEVTIPDSVTSIGKRAFEGCENLKTFRVSENHQRFTSKGGVLMTKDGKTLVSYPAGKTGRSYVVPDTVTVIEDSAFAFCHELSVIELPDQITSIGNDAFYDCAQLVSINLPDSIEYIGFGAFGACDSLASVRLPKNSQLSFADSFPNCTNLKTVTIPEGVTSVDEFAFGECTNLTTVILPDSLQYIGSGAFRDCENLADIRIPDGVVSLEGSAFKGTSWMKARQAESPFMVVNGILIDGTTCAGDVVIPDGVKIIGKWAFYDDSNYEERMNKPDITSITIPEGVVGIDQLSICNVKGLRSVTIPKSVSWIHAVCFDNYTSDIDSRDAYTIYVYAGSYAENYAKENELLFRLLDAPDVEGDVNGDGTSDILDVIFVNKFILGIKELDSVQQTAADFDKNGYVDSADSLALLKHVLQIQ